MQIKNALVTGVSKGLGKELCLILNSLGYKVHGISRTDQALLDKALVASLSTYHQIDLGDKTGVEQFINQNSTIFDLLIINAAERTFKNFSDFQGNEIESLINNSFTHQLILLNHVLKTMIQKNRGHIIIISSKSGIKGYSTGSLYCAIKAAWISIHESISRELKHTGIKLVTVIPDSFADTSGNKSSFFNKNVQNIQKIIVNLETDQKSRIVFSLTLKTRFKLFLEYCRKAVFV
ncbi:SDR family oxidoreductase [Desulfotignum phosphitoxidans]|uniref:Putative 3-oxoacyl-(Acyl-carrier-protein) reductase protein n=1 Tax=Desulfotignum phosphitoxidans DSM 13687 TaxID=1286635 RepID=S0FSK5_9BACT|nr:SDR family NAD(P)-dependent oxidoreductase [Desulfotignum phosphitoxidans]EMS77665.1 putative 3-oxoacyl-(acyl-carrier-protein) reductase protein [Desulfotignum phosphitoxidans DSM 13687]